MAPLGAPLVHPTPAARDIFIAALQSGMPLLAHNGVYDFLCAIAWWDCTELAVAALDDGRLIDTWDIARIAEIGDWKQKSNLGLDKLCEHVGIKIPDKKQILDLDLVPTHVRHLYSQEEPPLVRLSYGPLLNRPLSDYSPQQIEYVEDDAALLYKLYERLYERWILPGKVRLADAAHLTRKRIYLQRTSCWGLRTDPNQLEILEAATRKALSKRRTAAFELGVIRENRKNKSGFSIVKKELQQLVLEAYRGTPPLTDDRKNPKPKAAVHYEENPNTGRWEQRVQLPVDCTDPKQCYVPQVKTSRAVLEESGDARLEMIADMGEWAVLESTVIPAYRKGVYEPIHTRYSIVDTTRSSSSKPNVQNLRKAEGVRECFIPRPGFCFVHVDHTGLENCSLAQFLKSVLGLGAFADFLNAGHDLHTLVASKAYGCSYERAEQLYKEGDKIFKNVRNAVKPVDFGRPGGAGWKTLKFIAKQMYHLDWSETQTKEYIAAWEQAVPGGKSYHDWVGKQIYTNRAGQQRYAVPILGTGIVRRGCTFCSACNNGFQALGAVAEGEVGWAMVKEHFLGRTPEGAPSVLRQCYPCNFIHDEFAWEVPIGLQTAAAERLEWHMANSARHILPDLNMRSEAIAMSVWSKDAKRIFIDGQLHIWHPESTPTPKDKQDK